MVRLLFGVPALASIRRSTGFGLQALVLLTIATLALPGCGKTECESQADCSQGEFCDRDPNEWFSLSTSGECQDRGRKGESCNPYVNVKSPDPDRRLEGSCRPGLLCSESSQGGYVCIPPQGRGGKCEESYDCRKGLTCQLADVPEKHTCQPRFHEGEACGSSRDCQEGLACGKSGACQPWRQEGDPCAAYYECVSGMDCVDGICERL